MMSLWIRYVLKQLVISTFSITLILTFSMWLTQSLRFIDFVLLRGFPLTTFFKFIFFLIPDLLSILLPVATLIGVIYTYSKIYSDSELIILRASGLSNLQIIKPALMLSGIIIVILYAINFYFLPASFQKFKAMEAEIRTKVGTHMIHPGEFIPVKNVMLFVDKKNSDGSLEGILIQDDSNPEKKVIVMAEQGMIIEQEKSFKVVLLNGTRQEFNVTQQKPSLLTFKQYTMDLSIADKEQEKREIKPYERFIDELINPSDENLDDHLALKLKAEAHQRIVIPLTVVALVLIGLCFLLRGDYVRRGKSIRIVRAIVACLVIELMVYGALNLGQRFTGVTYLGYILIFVVSLLCMVLIDHRIKVQKQNHPGEIA
ncbi:MAG: LPS export ABC transporter permease LptF [Candidatus Nucleicultricaceae bacterium]